MARMLGKVSPPWCPICKAPPGPDCPDQGRSKRQTRAREHREWTREMLPVETLLPSAPRPASPN